MRNRCFVAVLGTAALLTACSHDKGGPTYPTGVPRVAFFSNPTYIDFRPDSYEAEASNLLAAIGQLGYQPTQFSALQDTAWARAAQADVIILPEICSDTKCLGSELYKAMSVAQRRSVTDFVTNGGTFIMSGAAIELVDSLFALNLRSGRFDPASTIGTAANGTTFAGGPSSLPYNAATYGVIQSSLPPTNTISVYSGSDVSGASSTVVVIRRGQGQIIMLGWDWYGTASIGGRDGGWVDVLDRAIRFGATGA